jgi:hypothetical protein
MIKNIADIQTGEILAGGFTAKREGASVQVWKDGMHFGTISGEGATLAMAE